MQQKLISTKAKFALAFMALIISTILVLAQQLLIAGKIVSDFSAISFTITILTLLCWPILLIITTLVIVITRAVRAKRSGNSDQKMVRKIVSTTVISVILLYVLSMTGAAVMNGKVLTLDTLAYKAEMALNSTVVFDNFEMHSKGTPGGDVLTGSEASVAARADGIAVSGTVGALRLQVEKNLSTQGYVWDKSYYDASSYISDRIDKMTLRYDGTTYRIYVRLKLTKTYDCPKKMMCSQPSPISSPAISWYDGLEVQSADVKLGSLTSIDPY